MRPLVIDDRARAEAARVEAWAKAHPYVPGPGVKVPGDDPRFVTYLNTYRVVFTYTHSDGGVWRHLSISIPRKNKYAHVAAAFMIAQLFGFTGWDERTIDRFPDGWMGNINERERSIVLVQAVGSSGKAQ